jgi:hypothetical protein
MAGLSWSFLVPSREKGLPVVWKGAPILGMSASQGSETEATLGKGCDVCEKWTCILPPY